jgi:hypothetical protein
MAALAKAADITNEAAAINLNVRGRVFIICSFLAGDTSPLNNCRGRVPQRGNSR